MKKVLSHFKIEGEFVSCVPYGEGHINDTYLVTFKDDNTMTKAFSSSCFI